MQNDLISRSALLKDVEDWHDSLGGTMNPADWGIQNVLQSVMDNIIEAEGVDALPVVHARWVQEYEDGWRCTRCGALWIFIDGGPEENGARFCPVCGALMDAKE